MLRNLSPVQFRTLFHGTAESKVGDIRETGLYPVHGTGGSKPEQYYMLTDNSGVAHGYGRRGERAVLTYKIPEHQVSEYLHEPLKYKDASYYAIKKPIPGSMIHYADAGRKLQ